MGRLPRYDRRDIRRAALRLAADHGPQAVTVADLAKEIGAPTGSIYHRYRSRELLLAELWMEVVEDFQAGFIERLERAENLEGAVEAARFMSGWSREHGLEARLLLLHRRQDFVSGDWPPELTARAVALEPQLGTALRRFGKRAFGRADADAMARLRFALLDAPFGGVRPYVQSGRPIPPTFDELVEATLRAVLATIPRQ